MKKRLILLLLSQLWLTDPQANEKELGKEEIARILQTAQAYIAEGRYLEAADLLERVLMFDENAIGVKKAYRQILKALDQQVNPSVSNAENNRSWRMGGKFSVNAGGGTNLNRAPAEKNIMFTLPNGQAVLELSEEQRPQSGYGVDTTASLRASKELEDERKISLALQIQNRNTDQQNFTDYVRINAGASLEQAMDNGNELGAALFGDVLQYDNEARFYALNFLVRHGWRMDSLCQPVMGLDLQWSHQKDISLFDSLYTGALLEARCLWGEGHYNFALQAGNEWAFDDRPGGNQGRIRLSMGHARELSWLKGGDAIKNYISLDLQKDQKGYSELLDSNSKRDMQRIMLGSQYLWPFNVEDTRCLGVVKIEWQKQYSNIQLFEFESLEIWAGVEVAW